MAAASVAGLASLPLLLRGNDGPAWARGALAGLIGLFAFAAARHHGARHRHAILYAVLVVAVGVAVAVGKFLLTGH